RLGQGQAGALLRHALCRPLRAGLRQTHPRGLALRRPRRGVPARRELAQRLSQRGLSLGSWSGGDPMLGHLSAMTSSAQDKQKEIGFFDGHAAADDYNVFTPAASQRVIDAFIALSDLKPPARVADLGCGSGTFTTLLKAAGYDCGASTSAPS